MNPTSSNYNYLRRKPKSNYRHLFIFDKGRYVSARTVYGDYMSEEEPRTVEQIAEDRDLPIDAVQEAIAYCESDPPEILQDWEMEEASLRAMGLNDRRADSPPLHGA